MKLHFVVIKHIAGTHTLQNTYDIFVIKNIADTSPLPLPPSKGPM